MDPEDQKIAPDEKTSRDDKLLLVWERAIQTQAHFAELSIKTRQVGMTVVGATLALAVVLNRTNTGFSLTFGTCEIHITSILCWTAAIVLYAIRVLDVGVYHRMLRGAVAFNEELEEKNLLSLFGTSKGLTQSISFFSRHPGAQYAQGKYSHEDPKSRHYAGNRISIFYWIMITTLALAGLALNFAGVK